MLDLQNMDVSIQMRERSYDTPYDHEDEWVTVLRVKTLDVGIPAMKEKARIDATENPSVTTEWRIIYGTYVD